MTEKESSTPARWDPFSDIDWFEARNPFRDFFRPSTLGRWMDEGLSRIGGQAASQLVPAVDITETDERYVITAEAAGITKDDVTVETKNNLLTIRGEKRNERSEEKENVRWVERRYGSFSRSLSLPTDANADQISASFKDGVLTIEIPKAEAEKPRVVSVKS